MRKNKFSSAADRRWQRRYERIKQRKEERDRRNAHGKDTQDDYFSFGFPALSQQETQRILDSFNLAESVRESVSTGEAPSSLWNRLYEYFKDDILEAFSRAAENYRADRMTDDWFDSFVDVKDIPFGDHAIFGVDLAGGVEVPEPDLDAGDSLALDSFLGEFLAPGA